MIVPEKNKKQLFRQHENSVGGLSIKDKNRKKSEHKNKDALVTGSQDKTKKSECQKSRLSSGSTVTNFHLRRGLNS